MKQGTYDLEERLLGFSVRIIRVTGKISLSRSGRYVADQLLRSGCSPYGNHGEAEGAESREDFIHKLRICYKELRETRRWLKLVAAAPLIECPEQLANLIRETDELVRVFSASIRTAQNKPALQPKPPT